MPETATPADARPLDLDQDEALEERRATLHELRSIRRILAFLTLVGVIIACYFARDVLLPLILGLLVALTLSPVVRVAGRRGIPAPVTAIALIVTLGAGIGVGGYAMSGPVGTWVEDAPEMGQELQVKLRGIFASVERMKEASEQVEEIAEGDETQPVQRVSVEQPGLISSALSSAATAGTTIAVAMIMALFLLASGEMFYVKLVESFPRMSEKKRALKIVYGVERAISRYLLTITAINACLGIVVGCLMWAIGLPNPAIWGVVAFVFNFLPFLGAIVGGVLAAAYAILSFDTIGQAFLAPALFLTATSLEGQLITPAILGRRLEMNTVSVFVTVVFWGWLWGIAGALMAVPFLVIVKVICDNIEDLQTVGNFLGASTMAVAVDDEERATG